MCSIGGVLALSSPAKFHHRREQSQIFTPTHLRNLNGFQCRWKNSRAFAPKLAQSDPNFASPISHLPLIRSSTSLHPSKDFFVQTLARKAAILLVGSIVFLGFCSSKPALALPAATVVSQAELDDEIMFEKLLESEPENMEALKAVLYKKMRRGKTEDAVKFVEKLMKLEPHEIEWKLLEALCYETMGQLSRAKRLFKDILKEQPLLIRALHGLAMVMHKTHDSSVFDMLMEAMEVARQGNRVTEERNIQVLIGQMHIVKGQFEEGLKVFQQMVNDNPRDFRPYLCQGIVYSLMEKKEEAAQQFEIYWSLVPEEFPQKGFLDDVALAAQAKSRERLQNTFKAKFAQGE
ncbi:PREDICTED: protein SLOW GREEN 1, chloroplastic [Camelina sativa]|uniref:Protein SLOW GREEN 1, chloroplastic n=1 Tax=Camelina sativa TaxID=90675 RepID=A0ABM0U7D1_CAMSA|nr:PREDICTED: protein SLOW GREEN 1, chloroplastic [Camelina sativa]